MTWYISTNASIASFQFTGQPARVPLLGAQRLDLPRVEDRRGRLEALRAAGGASSSRLIHAHPPHASHRTGVEVDVAGRRLCSANVLRRGMRGVRAVGAVAPAVERAGEAASRRCRGPRRSGRHGGGTRSGTRGRRCRRCARTMTDWSRNSYSTKSPGCGISSRRHAICQTRGHSSSASSCVEVGVEVALLRAPGRGAPSRRARAAPTLRSAIATRAPHRSARRKILTGRYNPPAPGGPWNRPTSSPTARDPRRTTSTSWSSAPASPASTSCTARGRRASRRTLLEAGGGVGGTWYWNRYPGARFDSESYTYAYLFSQELFDEWEWQEHFAEQPETERYLNHVVDRFDLRRHIRFGARVTAAAYDEASAHVDRRRSPTAREVRARFLVAATGVLSVPFFPDVPGRDDFRGESAPHRPVAGDAGRLRGQARRGHRHRLERRADHPGDRGRGRVAHRVPAHAPTGARRSTTRRSRAEEQAQLRADFEAIRETLNTSVSRLPPRSRTTAPRSTTPTTERRAFFEKMWNSPGFSKLTSNYTDLLFDPAANAEWCEFVAEKIRGIVADPDDRGEADPEGPPVRREAAAVRHRLLRGVQQPERLARRPEARRRSCASPRPGSRPPTACASSTSSCGRPASTSAPARSTRMGIRGRDGARARRPLGRRPEDVPRRPDHRASRTSSSPAGRTRRPATTRATTATRSTSSPTRSSTCATTATTRSRSTPAAEERWTDDGRPRRGDGASFGEQQLLLRHQHPRQAAQVPAQLGRPAEALQGDRPGRSTPTTRRSSCRARRATTGSSA